MRKVVAFICRLKIRLGFSLGLTKLAYCWMELVHCGEEPEFLYLSTVNGLNILLKLFSI